MQHIFQYIYRYLSLLHKFNSEEFASGVCVEMVILVKFKFYNVLVVDEIEMP
jgi:hypothetical protein